MPDNHTQDELYKALLEQAKHAKEHVQQNPSLTDHELPDVLTPPNVQVTLPDRR